MHIREVVGQQKLKATFFDQLPDTLHILSVCFSQLGDLGL